MHVPQSTRHAPGDSRTGQTRPRHADETEDRLRLALLHHMEIGRLDDLTASELARTAGVGRATFYRHHSSVAGYFEVLSQDVLGRVGSASRDEASSLEHPYGTYDALRALLMSILSVVDADVPLFRALWTLDGAPSFRERFRRTLADRVEDDLREYAGQLDPTYCPPEYVIAFETSAMVGVIDRWLRKSPRESIEDLGFYLLALIRDGGDVLSNGGDLPARPTSER